MLDTLFKIGKISTSIWFRCMKKKKSLMEGKRTMMHRAPTLVRTPKGISHW